MCTTIRGLSCRWDGRGPNKGKDLPGPRQRWPTGACFDSVETDRPVPLEKTGGDTKGEIEFAVVFVAGRVEWERCGGSDPRPWTHPFLTTPLCTPLRGFQCEDHMTQATDLFPIPPFAHSFLYRRILLLQQTPSTPFLHPPFLRSPPVRTMSEGQGQMQRRPNPILMCNP